MNEIKKQFPIFTEYQELVYLDNAATTQKPQTVIDSVVDFYTKYNANVHRGLYPLSETATNMYEQARRTVAKFLGAAANEIIFTPGTTDSLNMLASTLVNSQILPQELKILATDDAHHSNILPWQQIAAEIRYLPLDENYQLAIDAIATDLTEANFQPDLIAVALVSNVTGAITNIQKLRELYPSAVIVVDAAQAVAHQQIDVTALGADFLVFGGHKMYGPMGIGVLWGKFELLDKLTPSKVGGGMIREVKKDSASWAPLPERLEAGTPNVAGAIGLAAAVNFIESIEWKNIKNHESQLTEYAITKLSEVPGIQLFHSAGGHGVISFTHSAIHPHDLAQILGENNVAVRAGHHCTQILHKEILEIPASTRTSLAIYNNESDIDMLVEKINSAIDILN